MYINHVRHAWLHTRHSRNKQKLRFADSRCNTACSLSSTFIARLHVHCAHVIKHFHCAQMSPTSTANKSSFTRNILERQQKGKNKLFNDPSLHKCMFSALTQQRHRKYDFRHVPLGEENLHMFRPESTTRKHIIFLLVYRFTMLRDSTDSRACVPLKAGFFLGGKQT